MANVNGRAADDVGKVAVPLPGSACPRVTQ
jgi:hypothetical protein